MPWERFKGATAFSFTLREGSGLEIDEYLELPPAAASPSAYGSLARTAAEAGPDCELSLENVDFSSTTNEAPFPVAASDDLCTGSVVRSGAWYELGSFFWELPLECWRLQWLEHKTGRAARVRGKVTTHGRLPCNDVQLSSPIRVHLYVGPFDTRNVTSSAPMTHQVSGSAIYSEYFQSKSRISIGYQRIALGTPSYRSDNWIMQDTCMDQIITPEIHYHISFLPYTYKASYYSSVQPRYTNYKTHSFIQCFIKMIFNGRYRTNVHIRGGHNSSRWSWRDVCKFSWLVLDVSEKIPLIYVYTPRYLLMYGCWHRWIELQPPTWWTTSYCQFDFSYDSLPAFAMTTVRPFVCTQS